MKPAAQSSFVRRTLVAARAATRLKTVRVSTATGRPFKFLSAIWDLEQAPWREADHGETLLVFRTPTLGEAAPKLFQQGVLFDEDKVEEDWTVFDLLGQVLSDVQSSDPGELRADYGMLKCVGEFKASLKNGLDHASFDFAGIKSGKAQIDQPLVDRANDALRRTPLPRRIRVAGRLDMLKMSASLFQVLLEDGTRIRGLWNIDKTDLRPWLGKDVLMEGTGSFRANGEVVGIIAEAVRAAKQTDRAFRKAPRGSADTVLLTTIHPGKGTFSKIVGAWPGDETDEEINEFLREIS